MNPALDLTRRLCNIADTLVEGRSVQISDEAIRQLRHEVDRGRMVFSEGDFEIGYQATCLIECIAELAYARTDKDISREERARMYINSLRTVLRMDLNIAERKATAS